MLPEVSNNMEKSGLAPLESIAPNQATSIELRLGGGGTWFESLWRYPSLTRVVL